jgi:MFS family permease
VALQFSAGVFGTIGAALGGFLGDWFGSAKHASTKGRIGVALASVVGGIVFWGLFLFSTSYNWALLWYSLFHLWGGWTPAAAIRPICADLANSPSERAQVVAAWILLEKTSSAIFGAPLIGYLTKHMMDAEALGSLQYVDKDKAHALAFNLFVLSTLFWGLCAMFWLLMGRALDSSLGKTKGLGDEEENLIKDTEMPQQMSQRRSDRGLDNV